MKMRLASLVLLAALAAPALAQETPITPLPGPPPRPTLPSEPSLGFDEPPAQPRPATGWRTTNSRPHLYTVGTTSAAGMRGEEALVVVQRAPITRESLLPSGSAPTGVAYQTIPAKQFAGRRVRLSARLKTRDAARVQMHLTAFGGGPGLSYNMSDNPVRGTQDWRTYQIVMDVPSYTLNLSYGFFLGGGDKDSNGMAWADSFTLEPVGKDVAVTRDFLAAGYRPPVQPALTWDNDWTNQLGGNVPPR